MEIREHVPCGFEICEQATNLVPGEGSATAPVVIVGEAPGANEDAQGRPFVGRAGAILDDLLLAAGLAREEVFITNVVKARPPGNRDPRADEVAHHLPFLDAQLAVIRPRLLVPLGRHALKRFAPGLAIGEVHGHVIRVPAEAAQATAGRCSPCTTRAAALHNPRLMTTLADDARALRQAL